MAALHAKPDLATFSVGVDTRANAVSEAFTANAIKLKALLAAIRARGVAQDEIRTSNLDVVSLVSDDGRPAGFRVITLVTVQRQKVDSAAELLQAAVASGATQIGSLRYFLSDPGASRRDGFSQAFQDARSKAEVLATLSGRSLGRVVCVTEQSSMEQAAEIRHNTPERPAAIGYMDTSTVEPGSEERDFILSVVFELQ